MTSHIHTIILKAVSHCNLACRYCSAHAPGKQESTLDASFISNVFHELIKTQSLSDKVTVLWHGGEPTLYPTNMARNVMEDLARQSRENGIEIQYTIQTNGYSICDEWHLLIQDFHITPGISLDGPPEIHNLIRRSKDGKDTYDSILNTIERFKDSGIRPAVLSVIDKRHYQNVELYCDWLTEMKLPVRLNPYIDYQQNTPHWKEYYQFLKAIFEEILAREYVCSIEPLDNLIKALLLQCPPGECSYSGHCGQHIICLSPGNLLAPCGRMADNASAYSCFIQDGMIGSALNSILSESSRIQVEYQAKTHCSSCPYKAYCNGFCPAIRMLDSDNSTFCNAFGDFIDYLLHDGLKLIRKRLLIEKKRTKTFIANATQWLEKLKNE